MNTRRAASSIPPSPAVSEEGYTSPRQQRSNSVSLLIVRILIICSLQNFLTLYIVFRMMKGAVSLK